MSKLKDFKKIIEGKKELQIIIVDSKTGELVKEITTATKEEIETIINREEGTEKNGSNEIQSDICNNVFLQWKNLH